MFLIVLDKQHNKFGVVYFWVCKLMSCTPELTEGPLPRTWCNSMFIGPNIGRVIMIRIVTEIIILTGIIMLKNSMEIKTIRTHRIAK